MYLDRCIFVPTAGGTGDWTVSTAVQGYQTPASAGAVDQGPYYYAAQSADLSQWEVGSGTYTVSTTVLTRTTVLFNSLGTTAKINFTLAPSVSITALGEGLRELLKADRTYYVRTDGSDSNNGLVNTAAGAFLTVQKAVDTVAANIDLNGYNVIIQIADGTYTGRVILKNVVGYHSPGCLVIQGNNATPANVLINPTGVDAFLIDSIPAVWDIKDLKIVTTTSGSHINNIGSTIRLGNLDFGAAPGGGAHIVAVERAKFFTITSAAGNYAVSGNATYHVFNATSIVDLSGRTITFSNSPVFSYFILATGQAYCGVYTMTFTNGGTVTGNRFFCDTQSWIQTSGGGSTYLPGNVVNTADSTTFAIYN